MRRQSFVLRRRRSAAALAWTAAILLCAGVKGARIAVELPRPGPPKPSTWHCMCVHSPRPEVDRSLRWDRVERTRGVLHRPPPEDPFERATARRPREGAFSWQDLYPVHDTFGDEFASRISWGYRGSG